MQMNPGSGYRRNRFFNNIKGQCLLKLPKDVSADELNVIFGLGTATVAAAATFTFAQTAPRDLIIRDLVLDGVAGLVVTSINVSGDELVLGGAATSQSFSPGNQSRPSFDLPVAGGTQIKITVTNGTAGALLIAPAFNID
jgi:hypothetical protein